ncbi:glycine--tRNA ligase [Macrosteles quadrilineatus]|uniref:glycine--tRNA ligase n=1 Tax=Macrosteles quadrilineatus TaxID=74068 RepID=UPI0023E1F68B|nr:glycine--tRNA ligase [Macrosteles quadrilineatus]
MEVRLGILSTLLLTPLVCRQLVKANCHITRPSSARLNKSISQKRSFADWGSKKKYRNVKINLDWHTMGDPQIEAALAPLREKVKEQGDLVRSLKASGAPELDVKKAVAELKVRKKILEDKELQLAPAAATFDRSKMEDLLKRRFFYDQSFAIYGGITGQFDFGPMGTAFKVNMLNFWRRFFIIEEQMLEVDCSILTPEPVLKASGHVDRFADLMVKDTKTGECFRLDHLIKAALEKISHDKKTTNELRDEISDILIKLDGMTKDEMAAILKKFNILSPLTNNELTEPIEFNLMFQTQIGPSGLIKGFLRPETAQGIFVNFKRLLEFNQGRLPFSAAQIGNAFRNEISPRSGLIRVREFTMAEIEHFCDPRDKSHPKFSSIKDTVMMLYSACNQMDGKSAESITIGEAVATGLVANETLGYFMARIHQFLVQVGVDEGRLRFRQHMGNEMAHYACDCWDAECFTSYGWIECVGCADRSAYDLNQHFKATGTKLVAEKKLAEPKKINFTEAVPNKPAIGKLFKKDAKIINEAIAAMDENALSSMKQQLEKAGEYLLNVGGSEFKLTSDLVAVNSGEKLVHVEEIIPNVIEPSFGIGRIMYSVFEHNFHIRPDDEQRNYLSLPPVVAPLKVAIFPLSSNEKFDELVRTLSVLLTKEGIAHKVDDSSGSIGRRYARTDEIGVPFGITVDFDSLSEQVPSVTVRNRDTMTQIRANVTDIAPLLRSLSMGESSWEDVEKKFPRFEQQQTTQSG